MGSERGADITGRAGGSAARGGACLSAEGLTVERLGRTVVEGVDLAIEEGELLALLGPNGAGKTTVLKALLGLLPHGGSVRLHGVAIESFNRRERARRIAYVPQLSLLQSALDVRHVVAQGRFAHGDAGGALSPFTARGRRAAAADAHAHAVEEAMALTGVTAFAERAFTALSLGEQRRVLIARALATDAKVLLLDEPDAFLDIGQAIDLFELLGALRTRGHALLLVLHDLERAERWADRVLLLHRGTVAAHGPPKVALNRDSLARVFGVEAVPGGATSYRRSPRPEGTP